GLRFGPGDDNGKMLSPKISLQNRLTKFGVCEWRMNCCGIFCDPQEGSESKGKICRDLPVQGKISCACHVPILCSVQKWLLRYCQTNEPTGKGCGSCRNDPTAADKMLSYLRLPTDVAVAERQQRNLPQPQDNSACHEEIWLAGRDSPPQTLAADG